MRDGKRRSRDGEEKKGKEGKGEEDVDGD